MWSSVARLISLSVVRMQSCSQLALRDRAVKERRIRGHGLAESCVVAYGRPYVGEDRRLGLAIAMVRGHANQVADALNLDLGALDGFPREWRAALAASEEGGQQPL